MYIQKKLRQKISAVMAVVMILGNSMNVVAAPDSGGERAASSTNVKTANYEATLNWEKGTVLLSKTRTSGSWNTAEGMSPGATMLLDGSGQAREAQMTVTDTFDNEDGSGGAMGIRMSEEGEVSGVKSWFLFDSGIFCMGAGLENNAGGDTTLINVVDNVPVTSTLRAALVKPNHTYGIITNLTKTGGKWELAKDNPTYQDNNAKNWMAAGYSNDFEWHYMFNSSLKDSQVYCRFPTQNSTVSRFEVWVQPSDGTYQYTLGIKGSNTKTSKEYFPAGMLTVSNKVLKNTKSLQAVENLPENSMAVNKWTAGQEEVTSLVASLSLNQPVSVMVRKQEEEKKAVITLSALTGDTSSEIEVEADLRAESVTAVSNEQAVTQSRVENGKVFLTLDASKLSGPVTVEIQLKELGSTEGDTITVVRGDTIKLEKPSDLTGDVTWTSKIRKADGTYLRNVGSSSKKYELADGVTDGARTGGDTLADHLVYLRPSSDGGVYLTAKEKGNMVVIAKDKQGTEKVYSLEVLYEDPAHLPQVSKEDYAKIRQAWKESLVGTDMASQEGGAEIIQAIDLAAEEAWDACAYKGNDSYDGIPWPGDVGVAGSAIEYVDDAVEFRPAFQKVLAMAKAYSTEGSKFFGNEEMLQDMVHALDYLCGKCYTPKSQTDNWWTWEIGIPKDLIPILVLLYDHLERDQIMAYTEGLYFFQPDPYHEGAIGTASTHAQGYRIAQGANIIDCSTTAVGLGALREDNEQVYIGMLASSGTFVIQQVEDSTKLFKKGYVSGFYPDGSYLDHSHVPYIGSYGIEFLKGGVKIPSLIGGTPWQYPDQVQQNMEYYIVEGLGNSIYRGMMLDSLKGRSVARPGYSNRDSGREAMIIVLQMVDSLSEEARETVLPSLKYWMEEDPGFVDALKGVEYMAVKRKAQEILADTSIQSYVAPMHRSFPLMDRAIHRRDNYLFALSMFSERIQNTEIMNNENLYGWHQNNGMTYLYDGDDQYTTNYWNTVNPFRLAGTTVVPMNIGNGTPDSSEYYQEGDFLSVEDWVGGSAIGDYGISGMAFNGTIGDKGGKGISYAPNLRGKEVLVYV